MTTTLRNHLPELTLWLGLCRGSALREHARITHARLGVTQAVARDCAADSAAITTTAYAAEQEDREALKILATVAADPALPRPDLSALRRAADLITASAERDHAIAESNR